MSFILCIGFHTQESFRNPWKTAWHLTRQKVNHLIFYSVQLQSHKAPQKKHEFIHAGLLFGFPLWQSISLWFGSSACKVFSQSDELFFISFILFLWHILVLLSWGLQLFLKTGFVDINATTNSKHGRKGNLCEGYSLSKHDFFQCGISVLRHKMILKEQLQ